MQEFCSILLPDSTILFDTNPDMRDSKLVKAGRSSAIYCIFTNAAAARIIGSLVTAASPLFSPNHGRGSTVARQLNGFVLDVP